MKSRKKQRASAVDADFAKARAQIQKSGNIRTGLANLRHQMGIDATLRIAPKLAEHPAYRALIWPKPFPKSFGDLAAQGMPYYEGFETEIVWAAGTLRPHAKTIAEFLELRSRFEQAYLTASLADAQTILDTVEERFGQSLWLWENRLNILQERGETRDLRDRVREVMGIKNVPAVLRYMFSWIAYKCEASVSRAEMRRLLDGEEAAGGDIIAYILRAVTGENPVSSPDMIGKFLSNTDNFPVVDRYLYLLLSFQLFAAGSDPLDSESVAAKAALQALRSFVADPQLGLVAVALGVKGGRASLDTGLLEILDAYSIGEYGDSLTLAATVRLEDFSVELINVALRARLLSGCDHELFPDGDEAKPLRDIATDLIEVLTFGNSANEAHLRLQKRILTHCNSGWANSLALILLRQHSDDRILMPTRSQKMHTLRSQRHHPETGFGLPDDRARETFFTLVEEECPNSVTAKSLRAVFSGEGQFSAELASERVVRLEAMMEARRGEWPRAAVLLEASRVQSQNALSRNGASLLLIRSYLEQGRLADCATLAADLCIHGDFMGRVLPISELVGELVKVHDEPISFSSTRGLLSVAIVYDIYSRYIGSDRDAERADAFKDVLRKAGVKCASELVLHHDKFDADQLLYFLQYICVPDVLDQSLTLSSTRAVEDERAAILVGLSDMIAALERPQPAELKDELREIRTKQVVRETTLRLDQSKVYVNVDGLRRALDVSMRDNWHRYRILKLQGGSAELKEIEKILRSAGSEYRIILLDQGSQERTKVLSRLVNEAIEMFAFSKEFGLDSNLSTNIRHGYVLRELRSPLVTAKLITNKGSESGSYQPNAHWLERLEEESDAIAITEIFDVFSGKIDELIDRVNRKLLRIRSAQSPDGLFVYAVDEILLAQIENRCADIDSHEQFLELMLEYCWTLTDANLARVRKVLTESVLQEFSQALTDLSRDLTQKGFSQTLPAVIQAINLARPEVRSAVERVASWFTLSNNDEYQDFDLEIAYEAGIKAVKTYYSNVAITEKLVVDGSVLLKGWTLPIFARLFFLLLDNTAQHGAAERNNLNIEAKFEVTSEHLMIEVSNDLPDEVDLDALEARVTSINADYGREKASDLLRQEGGSGYPKIWKLLNFDLRKPHELMVKVEDGRFVVQLMVESKGLVA